MINSRVTIAELGFVRVTEALERKAREAVAAAAAASAAAAQGAASIDLELEVKGPRGTAEGQAAGISSRRRGSRGAPIALFFDKGTLGNRRTRLSPRSRRRDAWPVKRASGYTAHRREVTPGSGIKAENFFSKARAAGRRALIDTLRRS